MTDDTPTEAGSQPFDTEALQAYMGRHVPGFHGPLQVERFAGGQSNPTYRC